MVSVLAWNHYPDCCGILIRFPVESLTGLAWNIQSNTDSPIEALEEAILNLHGCKSTWIQSVPVKEVFQGQTVWEGVVQVFELIDHPTAKRCYTWSYVMDESGKRKFIAVLHEGPIDSPKAAVKASIVGEYKTK